MFSVLVRALVRSSNSDAGSVNFSSAAATVVSRRGAVTHIYPLHTMPNIKGTKSSGGSNRVLAANNSDRNGKPDPIEIENICPGSARLLTSGGIAEEVVLPWNAAECSVPVPDLRAMHGVVFGKCSNSRTFCQFFVQVPEGLYANVHIRIKSSDCGVTPWRMNIYAGWPPFPKNEITRRGCSHTVSNTTKIYMSYTNKVYLSYFNSPRVQVLFEGTKLFQTVHTSKHGGYVTFSAFRRRMIKSTTFRTHLKAPPRSLFMVSLELFYQQTGCEYLDGECYYCVFRLALSWKDENTNQTLLSTFKSDNHRSVNIYHAAKLEIHIKLNKLLMNRNCMKMLFSIHPRHEKPQRLNNGLFNCSVHNYWRFQQHLDCNRKTECEGGLDESEQCPFRNRFCKDEWVKSHNKCYTFIRLQQTMSYQRAREECKRHGLKQGTVKTKKEMNDFLTLFQGRGSSDIFIGLSSGWTAVPFMYRKFCKWSDNTMIYNLDFLKIHKFHVNRTNVVYHLYSTHPERRLRVASLWITNLVCEKNIPVEEILLGPSVSLPSVLLPSSYFTNTRQSLTLCPHGHVTHQFLICDPNAKCGQVLYESVCTFLNSSGASTEVVLTAAKRSFYQMLMYTCSVGAVTIPYTLVCDFMSDCPDQSDESFCTHPSCSAFTCKNGQCVSIDDYCDEQSDCLDDSDEADCQEHSWMYTDDVQIYNQSVLINLDGSGYFTRRVMSDSETCPNTHYRCTTEQTNCLPVYTRCNGIYDCIYHEDERDCDELMCPGFYRCRGSTVCVHVDHLCDGWPQCVQRDDEWLCDTICPEGCLCQGQAFLCRQSFSAHLYHHLRYLDAKGSGMALLDLNNHSYLVHLSLAYCSMRFLPTVFLPNLKTLDLGYNMIVNLTLHAIYKLQNLQNLILRGNPIVSIDTGHPNHRQTALKSVDLSETYLGILDSQDFIHLPQIQTLNASFAWVHSITRHGLTSMSHLEEIDIRGNLISKFPDDLFLGLSELTLVHTSDYKLCCRHLLPVRVPATQCLAPQPYVSSCHNMLQVEAHRGYLWVIGAIASLANALCMASHCRARKGVFTLTFTTFMSNLQSANLCMGISTTVIAVAQEVFRGEYYKHEREWTDSVACKAAGFLSLLSTIVSVLTIWLLTLDQIIVLHASSPVSKFGKRSVLAACGLTWITGSVFASLPLLPALELWNRHSRTAVCNFILSSEQYSFHSSRFLQSVLIIKVLLCLVVTGGTAVIYKAMPKYQTLVDPVKKPIYNSIHLLVKVALTDSLAWFLLAMNRFITLEDVTGYKTNIAIAVVLLPLNSALNPVLYVWHVVCTRRREKRDQRLLRRLKAQLKFSGKPTPGDKVRNVMSGLQTSDEPQDNL